MKKNILAENMRRFGTKNLNEAHLEDLENIGFGGPDGLGGPRDPKTGNLKVSNADQNNQQPGWSNTPEKRKMLFNKIKSRIPGREREFLEFIAMSANSFTDYSKYNINELLDSFIMFEEGENEEELTSKITDNVLNTYIPAFENGEDIF